ncbi:uncharacterized protein HD556DRAFT_1308888 [Suillus plorans]|uniref:Uncharacterized protein n=1 Tax=Suillus plorans TaxID=116603 RepID=A0A9P7APW9_9AGAM|nr:uncharacterized protein HD556DRAFT_1308888 [Suillus plorans]KAG1793172.1 hypothetical protein HD556DRAFT_1308888 [Suillus plorans]
MSSVEKKRKGKRGVLVQAIRDTMALRTINVRGDASALRFTSLARGDKGEPRLFPCPSLPAHKWGYSHPPIPKDEDGDSASATIGIVNLFLGGITGFIGASNGLTCIDPKSIGEGTDDVRRILSRSIIHVWIHVRVQDKGFFWIVAFQIWTGGIAISRRLWWTT